MDIKRFILSYYRNATSNFHINLIKKPTEALKLHTHNYFQVYYVVRGSIRHHLEEQNALLGFGDVFIIPPNVPHFISVDEEDSEFYSLSFMPEFFDDTSAFPLLSDFLRSLVSLPNNALLPKLSISSDDSLFIETLLGRVMKEFNEKNVGSQEIILESVAILISIFARNYFEERIEKMSIGFETNKHSVLHCIEYLSTHYTEKTSLDEISKYATMSKSNFCKIFYSITNTTFNQFIHNKRIEKATQMLSATNLKVTTVAVQCGYEDFSTFFRNFKKITGLSPAEFKKRHCSL